MSTDRDHNRSWYGFQNSPDLHIEIFHELFLSILLYPLSSFFPFHSNFFPFSFFDIVLVFSCAGEIKWHVINPLSFFSFLQLTGYFQSFLTFYQFPFREPSPFNSFPTRYFCYDQTPEKIPFYSVLMSIMEYKLLWEFCFRVSWLSSWEVKK